MSLKTTWSLIFVVTFALWTLILHFLSHYSWPASILGGAIWAAMYVGISLLVRRPWQRRTQLRNQR
jgi:hypothetical protein